MELWQQQLQEILSEKKVVEEGVGEPVSGRLFEQRPGFTFVVGPGPGAAIDITPIEILISQGGQLQGETACRGMQILSTDALLLPKSDVRIEEGVWVESCEPYVIRAIDRCSRLWHVPPDACGILAVLPRYKMLDFYDVLIYEYAHRYCSARSRNQNRKSQSSGKWAFTLERSTTCVEHDCGALVLRQRLDWGGLRRRGASFTFQIEERPLVFRTLSGLPITHCPACGTKLNGINSRSLG